MRIASETLAGFRAWTIVEWGESKEYFYVLATTALDDDRINEMLIRDFALESGVGLRSASGV